ncbi:MAG: hypothetical protein ACI3XT_08170 [Butyricicoccaceae bacterium]|nr:hypothetical protein [Clostridia bacterium]
MSIFEAGMLICFGAAWPMNIINSLRTKSSKGKNLPFQIAILVGYICGITHKILYSQDIVMVLYIINFVMVAIDTGLYFYNKSQGR